MKNLSNKVFVVTGAGNGVGRALTLELLRQGAKVAALDISETYLQETERVANANKLNLKTYVVDITNDERVANIPSTIEKDFGQIDGLINNAGIIQPFVKVMQLQNKDIDRVMRVNFYGTLNMCRAFLPLLVKRPEANLVNISSMGGFTPVPGQAVYGASKAAVKLLTEALYAELKGTPVSVTVVFPGAIGTNITKNSGVDMNMSKADAEKMAKSQKTLSPERAANMIINQGIKKNLYRLVVGSDASALDKISRLFPKFATNMIAKAMKRLLK
ncbi:MAG: putative oxidoreductase SadH [Bacillota bacterium]|jgi:short-subunit dehydrogenase